MKRRDALKTLGAIGVTGGWAFQGPSSAYGKTAARSLTLASAWPSKTPIIGDAIRQFAEDIQTASDNCLQISIVPDGTFSKPSAIFQAVVSGEIDFAVGTPYYWGAVDPALQFFGSVPFGLDPQGFNAWLIAGDGQELWEESYKNYRVVPLSLGNSGVQMGGWFKHEIKSIRDFRNLRMRILGLGAKVLRKLGTIDLNVPPSAIYNTLKENTLDAAEWVSPFHDSSLRLYEVAKFYYHPGWHEPSSNIELLINSDYWKSLSMSRQTLIRAAAARASMWSWLKSDAENGPALRSLLDEHHVKLKRFPDRVLKELRRVTDDVLLELAGTSPLSSRIYDSYQGFQKNLNLWNSMEL